MQQSWHDLLFAHWPIAPAEMAALIPPQLKLDTYDGTAWVGVVPFGMAGVYPRGTFPVPGLSAFPELNVRTYVTTHDDSAPYPGVYFFSLDAANAIAVALARSIFHLPYFRAAMRQQIDGGAVTYTSRRTHAGAPSAEFAAHYAPDGEVYAATPNTLEYWLTERYCLYTFGRHGELLRGEIHHRPWPLQPAQADIQSNSMAAAAGIHLPNRAPILHFARHIDVVVWPLQTVQPAPSA